MAAWDYDKIAVAFEGDRPTGVNLREDSGRVGHYHAIRDARSAARSEDRSLENPVVIDGGNRGGEEDIHQPSNRWADVHNLCLEALLSETKDIELLAWLAEAAVRVHGITALAGILTALNALIETHFDALHSIGDETADKLIPLTGLNGSQDSDGTLIRPLRLISLVPNQIYGRLSLWEFQQARKINNAVALSTFQQEFSHLDGVSFAMQRDAVERCYKAIAEIDARLTSSHGADAPSFGRVRDVLEDLRHAYGELSGYVKLPEVPAAALETANMVSDKPNGGNGATGPSAAQGQIADREQAFRSLLEIAAFFRKTEPHSSLPLALETLVRRGRMDFMGLLTELIPDDNQRREMLTRAGIHAAKSPDGS